MNVISKLDTSIWVQLAEQLFDRHQRDLSHVLIILPDMLLAKPLQHALLARMQALLLPDMQTLSSLSASYAPVSAKLINKEQCLYLLAAELKHHKDLCGPDNYWPLASDLLRIFEALTLERGFYNANDLLHAEQMPFDLAALTSLTKEADVAYRLWQAWRQQLRDEARVDPIQQYISGLWAYAKAPPHRFVYWLHQHTLNAFERAWQTQLQAQVTLTEVALELPRDNALCTLLNAPNKSVTPSREQTRALFAHLNMAEVDSAEHQATLVTQATREALLASDEPVYIITEDRRLARRIRAMLERIRVSVDDKVGWPLSTTQAGACLEHWLRCLEQDFNYLAVLDVLNSPYCLPNLDHKARLIQHFTRHLVYPERTVSSLTTYIDMVKARRPVGLDADLLALFKQLKKAAQPLLDAMTECHATAQQWLTAFLHSLKVLEIQPSLEQDAAGQQVLQLLDRLSKDIDMLSVPLSWADFRHWLHLALEHAYFRPPVSESRVMMLRFQQAHWLDGGHRILCGLEQAHWPPRTSGSAFFTDEALVSLGCRSQRDQYQQHYIAYLHHLSCAGTVLLSWQTQQDGEWVAPSDWVQLLQEAAQYLEPNAKIQAQRLIESSRAAALPGVERCQYTQPRPRAAALIKEQLTVSAHQRLVNCPYYFYVQDLLGLGALDDIRENMEKSDYGIRVHLALQAFYQPVPGLPEPFADPVTEDNREAAILQLTRISRAVFTQDITHNFQHRSWLTRWLDKVPDYIDWEIRHRLNWRSQQYEVNVEHKMDNAVIKGRVDRIDVSSGSDPDLDQLPQRALIDYKTGEPPSIAEIENGEDVQLSTYAFALEHIQSMTYLGLGQRGRVKECQLEGDPLHHVSKQVQNRLDHLLDAIRNHNQPLPAWGQQDICSQCKNAGICRRDFWSEHKD